MVPINSDNLPFTDTLSPVQSGLSEDELGGFEEVNQRVDQQSECVQHCQHHPGAAARERCQRKVAVRTHSQSSTQTL